MSIEPSGAIPSLARGEIYVYSHGNGAILLKHADGRSMLAPLDEVVSVAERCHASGARVLAAWDDTPLATQVIDRIRAAGVPVVEFEASRPPHWWNEGTTALHEAAADGADRILDDLVERGADLHHRDDSGSTPIHHAAAHGNLHAIDRLAAAGADVNGVNARGFTPHMVATACGEGAAAQRLVELGATVSNGPASKIRFRPVHYGVYYVWLLPVLLIVGVLAFMWPLPPLGLVGLAAYALTVGLIAPPPAFWAGGVPRELEGTSLVVRSVLGRRRTIDLGEVTTLAAGGSTTTTAFMAARWLILGHPEGRPATRRTLRKLLVPRDEIDPLAERMDRVIVVVIAGSRRNEVLVPVGNLLMSRGIHLSRTAHGQISQAWAAQAPKG